MGTVTAPGTVLVVPTTATMTRPRWAPRAPSPASSAGEAAPVTATGARGLPAGLGGGAAAKPSPAWGCTPARKSRTATSRVASIRSASYPPVVRTRIRRPARTAAVVREAATSSVRSNDAAVWTRPRRSRTSMATSSRLSSSWRSMSSPVLAVLRQCTLRRSSPTSYSRRARKSSPRRRAARRSAPRWPRLRYGWAAAPRPRCGGGQRADAGPAPWRPARPGPGGPTPRSARGRWETCHAGQREPRTPPRPAVPAQGATRHRAEPSMTASSAVTA